MYRLAWTSAVAAENLALDEALLETAEAAPEPREVLRLWEPARPMVVLGRSSVASREVDFGFCQSHEIPVLRRTSGGLTIVTGPGCLMFSLVLSYDLRAELRSIDRAHREVLGRLVASLGELLPAVAIQGTSDLTLGDRKFSGNSLRSRRRAMLYHGTLLFDFDLPLISACLKQPPRAPDYRQSRTHEAFVTNLPLARETLIAAVDRAWPTQGALAEPPWQMMKELTQTKYARPEWNQLSPSEG